MLSLSFQVKLYYMWQILMCYVSVVFQKDHCIHWMLQVSCLLRPFLKTGIWNKDITGPQSDFAMGLLTWTWKKNASPRPEALDQ